MFSKFHYLDYKSKVWSVKFIFSIYSRHKQMRFLLRNEKKMLSRVIIDKDSSKKWEMKINKIWDFVETLLDYFNFTRFIFIVGRNLMKILIKINVLQRKLIYFIVFFFLYLQMMVIFLVSPFIQLLFFFPIPDNLISMSFGITLGINIWEISLFCPGKRKIIHFAA